MQLKKGIILRNLMESTNSARLADTNKIEVRQTTNTGFGLFATQDFAPGEVVMLLADHDTPTTKIMRWKESFASYFDRSYTIVPNFAFCSTPDHIFWNLNHSCNPNAGYVNWGRIENGHVPIVAHRVIKAGEEITADYAVFTTHDDGSADGIPWEMEGCGCGQPNCRGTIRGFEATPRDIQLENILATGNTQGRVLAHVVEYLPDLVEILRRESPTLYDSYLSTLDNLKRRSDELEHEFAARSQ
jgi:hypothetical protein